MCHQCQVPVIRAEDIFLPVQRKTRADLCRFLALTGYDEREFTRPVQQPHPLIELPRQQHCAVHFFYIIISQTDFFMISHSLPP